MLEGRYTVEGSTEITNSLIEKGGNFNQGWITNLSTVHCTVVGEGKRDNDPIIM